MGLDNGIVCSITSKKFDVNVEYDICYWRKYWGLRDKFIGCLDKRASVSDIALTEDIISDFYVIVDYYAEDIDRLRDEPISNIWGVTAEYNNMLTSRNKLFCILELFHGKISPEEFIELTYNETTEINSKIDESDIDIISSYTDKPVLAINEMGGCNLIYGDDEDLLISFYFYDSY